MRKNKKSASIIILNENTIEELQSSVTQALKDGCELISGPSQTPELKWIWAVMKFDSKKQTKKEKPPV